MTSNIVSLHEVSSQKKTAILSRYLAKYAELQKLKQELEELKVESIELLGEGQFETTKGKLTIKWVERDVLDQGRAKSFLTPAQLSSCFRKSSFYDVRISFKGV